MASSVGSRGSISSTRSSSPAKSLRAHSAGAKSPGRNKSNHLQRVLRKMMAKYPDADLQRHVLAELAASGFANGIISESAVSQGLQRAGVPASEARSTMRLERGGESVFVTPSPGVIGVCHLVCSLVGVSDATIQERVKEIYRFMQHSRDNDGRDMRRSSFGAGTKRAAVRDGGHLGHDVVRYEDLRALLLTEDWLVVERHESQAFHASGAQGLFLLSHLRHDTFAGIVKDYPDIFDGIRVRFRQVRQRQGNQ